MVQEKLATFSHIDAAFLPKKTLLAKFRKCCKCTNNAARRTNNIFTKHAVYSSKKCFV